MHPEKFLRIGPAHCSSCSASIFVALHVLWTWVNRFFFVFLHSFQKRPDWNNWHNVSARRITCPSPDQQRQVSGSMICRDVFWLYGRLGRAAEREWTERNATDWRTPCRKFLVTPLVKALKETCHVYATTIYTGLIVLSSLVFCETGNPQLTDTNTDTIYPRLLRFAISDSLFSSYVFRCLMDNHVLVLNCHQ